MNTTIVKVAEGLNSLAISGGYLIAQLPELRKKYLGKKVLPDSIFTEKTIFYQDDVYAFHYGGRDEIQFNIGEEIIGGKPCTRYVLGISLEKSRSLPYPIETLSEYKGRFNKCCESHLGYFSNMKMWYFHGGERIGNFPVRKIDDRMFQLGNFIAVGYILNKPIRELDTQDMNSILAGFDELLPIYKYCVLDCPSIFSKERRIAKLCWNEYNWMYPSGKRGKSHDKNSYERVRGYGHEEWLFDLNKVIEGYHYGLLQPIETSRESYLSKSFDVRLFSHNADTKDNIWVGFINNLEVISQDEAKEVHAHYKEQGWLEEMATQIIAVDGDYKHFSQLQPHHCFNIRFKPEDARLDKPFRELTNFDKIIGTYHYAFIHDDKVKHKSTESGIRTRKFLFNSGKKGKSLKNRVSLRESIVIESEPLHDKIQSALFNVLSDVFGENNVGMENDTGLSTRIDILVNRDKGYSLYEVKSYPSVMMSLRNAIGQLLEYAYWPSPLRDHCELIVVSHIPAREEDKKYLEYLRNAFKLNVYYQSIDLEKNTLSEKS